MELCADDPVIAQRLVGLLGETDQAVAANVAFIHQRIRTFRVATAATYDDLVAAGLEVAVRLWKEWDPDRENGAGFTCYITKPLTKALLDTVRLAERPDLSYALWSKRPDIIRTRDTLAVTLGREPSDEEIADAATLTRASRRKTDVVVRADEVRRVLYGAGEELAPPSPDETTDVAVAPTVDVEPFGSARGPVASIYRDAPLDAALVAMLRDVEGLDLHAVSAMTGFNRESVRRRAEGVTRLAPVGVEADLDAQRRHVLAAATSPQATAIDPTATVLLAVLDGLAAGEDFAAIVTRAGADPSVVVSSVNDFGSWLSRSRKAAMPSVTPPAGYPVSAGDGTRALAHVATADEASLRRYLERRGRRQNLSAGLERAVAVWRFATVGRLVELDDSVALHRALAKDYVELDAALSTALERRLALRDLSQGRLPVDVDEALTELARLAPGRARRVREALAEWREDPSGEHNDALARHAREWLNAPWASRVEDLTEESVRRLLAPTRGGLAVSRATRRAVRDVLVRHGHVRDLDQLIPRTIAALGDDIDDDLAADRVEEFLARERIPVVA